MHALVRAATAAPSADNSQPWRFHWAHGRLDVGHDPSRALLFDTHFRASLLSVGAALENLRLAAPASGYETAVEYFPDERRPELVARVMFDPTDPVDERLSQFIFARATNRRPYARTPLDSSAERRLREVAAGAPAVEVRVTTDRRVIAQCARLVMAADLLRYRTRAFHAELFRAIRFPASAGADPGEGLPLKALEVGLLGEAVLKLARPWSRASLLNRVGLARLMAAHSYLAVLRSGALALLAVRDRRPPSYVSAGRVLERVWLEATALELAVQPLSLGTLLLLEVPDRPLARRLHELRSRLDTVLAVTRGTEPVMLLRLGRAPAPSARSPRREVRAVLTAEGI